MKYFLHDCNALQDEKICTLYLNFGYEGVGLFYAILERLGGQEKPIKTEVLKAQLHVGKKLNKCWLFMESLGIISSNNGETFNERILSYSETYEIKKQKTRERISKWRDNQKNEKNVTRDNGVSNAPKVKRSKVKRSKEIKKENNTHPSLEEVVCYFKENNYPENLAQKAFSFYNSANWKDSKGNEVKNWKQKMIGVWFKDENKVSEISKLPITPGNDEF